MVIFYIWLFFIPLCEVKFGFFDTSLQIMKVSQIFCGVSVVERGDF